MSLRKPTSCLAFLRTSSLMAVMLLAACGDPAPGEGVDEPHAQDTAPEIMSASEAVRTPEISTIDLQTMDAAEFEEVIGTDSRCSFTYTRASAPAFVASVTSQDGAEGAIKIHGKLVRIVAREVKTVDDLVQGTTFTADGLRVHVSPRPKEDNAGGQPRQANVVLELEQGLKVGYRGWYACRKERSADS